MLVALVLIEITARVEPLPTTASQYLADQKHTKTNSPFGAVRWSAYKWLMIKMVIALVTNGFLERTVHSASIKAMSIAAAIGPVVPFMYKHRKTRDTTDAVFLGELRAVRVSNVGLREVSSKPDRVVEGLFEFHEICNHLGM
jgi:hypothetical protein